MKYNACSRGVRRPKLHALAEAIRNSRGCEYFPAAPELLEEGLKLHAQRPDKEWAPDRLPLFVVMRRQNITRALAFDHHFEQARFAALLRCDPPA